MANVYICPLLDILIPGDMNCVHPGFRGDTQALCYSRSGNMLGVGLAFSKNLRYKP